MPVFMPQCFAGSTQATVFYDLESDKLYYMAAWFLQILCSSANANK